MFFTTNITLISLFSWSILWLTRYSYFGLCIIELTNYQTINCKVDIIKMFINVFLFYFMVSYASLQLYCKHIKNIYIKKHTKHMKIHKQHVLNNKSFTIYFQFSREISFPRKHAKSTITREIYLWFLLQFAYVNFVFCAKLSRAISV